MLELLDPEVIDPIAYDKGYLGKICQYSLLPNQRIGWNYCMDYTWLLMRLNTLKLNPKMRIIDVGCGPGAIHGYLEDIYGVNITGIDTRRWDYDYVDIVGNVLDPETRRNNGISNGSIDIIISTSAFEHNLPDTHRQIVEVCMQCLKPGGHLITTFSAAEKTHSTPDQWNLSRKDIESIYREKFDQFEYHECWLKWRNHREMPQNYENRYGSWTEEDPKFISAGAHLIKFF